MDGLVQWLRAQLDTDAARATAAAEEDGSDWQYDGHAVITRREGDMVAVGSQDLMDRERGEHIAAHDPARVLREIDAKRWFVEMLANSLKSNPTTGIPRGVAWSMLTRMAEVYRDRPGWQSYWPGSG